MVMESTLPEFFSGKIAVMLMAPDDAGARKSGVFLCLHFSFPFRPYLPRDGGEEHMNCYLCFLHTGQSTREALGICQLCGAGCCEHHLLTIISNPVVGMAGMPLQRRQMRCSLCQEEIIARSRPHAPPVSRKEHADQSPTVWWRWLSRRRQSALPESEEAIALVERFLKHDRKQKERDGF